MKMKKNIFKRYLCLGNQRGMVLLLVMSFMALVMLSSLSVSTMIQRDVTLIDHAKTVEQARLMAEAGVNHALAEIQLNGFATRANFSNILDIGSYDVTHTTSGGRFLVTSIGTVNGVSKTVTAEVADNLPTALNYFSGAGNDININALIAGANIVGDIHANNDVNLKSGPLIAWLLISGNVCATGIVKEGTRYNTGSWDWWDNHVSINGHADDTATVFEGQDRITFPTFNYSNYQAAAQETGDYYATSQVFNGEALNPSNGIVYIDGDVEFRGACSINGGIIANQITVIGSLTQTKTGNRNVILAKNGDIRIFGRLFTEEALVFAAQDILTLEILADIDINGIMLARRNIAMWNFLTLIDYTYVFIAPSDLLGPDGEDTFELVSWNQ